MLTIAKFLANSLNLPRGCISLTEERLNHLRQKVVAVLFVTLSAGRADRAFFHRARNLAAHSLEGFRERVEGGAHVARDGDGMGTVIGGGGDFGEGCEEGGQVWATTARGGVVEGRVGGAVFS